MHELHDGTSNVREQKHCLALNEYNSFAMKENELVRDMYSRLNLTINELNSIGINKLGDVDIVIIESFNRKFSKIFYIYSIFI